MPELPEIETLKNGLSPHLKNILINSVTIRQANLRWPIPSNIKKILSNSTIIDISRRGKYLLFHLSNNAILMMHLGMSGTLRLVDNTTKLKKHDHVDIILNNNKILRYNDPRRFGAILLASGDKNNKDSLHNHLRLKDLGPEPLTNEFNADYMIAIAKNKNAPVKHFIMNNKVVVGVGNIYATEALFYSKINPTKPVADINQKQWQVLVTKIKNVLIKAIECGGTTFKDFINADGKPGYFKQELSTYGRAGQPCIKCNQPLLLIRQQGRATVYCEHCQN